MMIEDVAALSFKEFLRQEEDVRNLVLSGAPLDKIARMLRIFAEVNTPLIRDDVYRYIIHEVIANVDWVAVAEALRRNAVGGNRDGR